MTRSSPLKAYLQLFRLPNVFTAFADVLMGFFFVAGGSLGSGLAAIEDWRWLVACLLAASGLLYTAGMVLNDVFDIEVDRRERPFRPLPAGRINLGLARGLGFGMLLAGAGFGWAAAAVTGDIRPGVVASLLAVAVLAYDGFLKRTPLGPLAMGSCRFLNVLLGMSAAPGAWTTVHFAVAAGIGIYIAGVTWFARQEATESSRFGLGGGLLVMLLGIGTLAVIPQFIEPTDLAGPQLQMSADRWYWTMAGLAAIIGWRPVRAIAQPSPVYVQAAVKNCIFSLVVLDAAVAAAVAGFAAACLVFALLFPTLFLGRWIYST